MAHWSATLVLPDQHESDVCPGNGITNLMREGLRDQNLRLRIRFAQIKEEVACARVPCHDAAADQMPQRPGVGGNRVSEWTHVGGGSASAQ